MTYMFDIHTNPTFETAELPSDTHLSVNGTGFALRFLFGPYAIGVSICLAMAGTICPRVVAGAGKIVVLRTT